MSIRFRLLTEADVRAVLRMDDLIETMASALRGFSTGRVEQPVRTIVTVSRDDAFFGTMPAYMREEGRSLLGAKLVTVFGANAKKGIDTHLATILLLDPQTGALLALLDGRYITETRTAAVSAVSSRLLARKSATSLAIIGSGVQARSHLLALSTVHALKHVSVWSPNRDRRERFVRVERERLDRDRTSHAMKIQATDHAGEAVVGADLIVLATSSTKPVIESGWVKPGAHVISVGACRPNQREMDPELTARAALFVDSRAAALVESGDVVIGIEEGRFGPDHIVAEIGEVAATGVTGRRNDAEVTMFKSLGMAVEDVAAADLVLRRAAERGLGIELTL